MATPRSRLIPHSDFNPVPSPPVEQRFTDAARCHGGVWPHEILLLDHAQGRSTNNQDLGDFWQNAYGVSDPGAVLTSLAERDFIRASTIGETIDREATIPTLKEELAKHSLPLSGKKSDLIGRLIGNVPGDELASIFSNRRWILTDAGREAIDAEPQVFYADSPGVVGMDIWSLSELVHQSPGSWRDAIWGYLNKYQTEHPDDPVAERAVRLDEANVLMFEERWQDALQMATLVLLSDINGRRNDWTLEGMARLAGNIAPYFASRLEVGYGVGIILLNVRYALDISDGQLREMLMKPIQRFSSMCRVFTPDECADIAILALNFEPDDITRLDQMYETARGRLRQQYPNVAW